MLPYGLTNVLGVATTMVAAHRSYAFQAHRRTLHAAEIGGP